MRQPTVADLVALARAGDRAAFGELYERHLLLATRLALRTVGNAEVAQDLAQEALLQAYLSLEQLRDDRLFTRWVCGIVANVCRAYFRDRHAGVVSAEALLGGRAYNPLAAPGPVADPQELVEARELQQLMWDAVQGLSAKNRAATVLFYYQHCSLQETADRLGVTVTVVKGRLHKARRALRARLATHGIGAPTRVAREQGMVKVTVADVVQRADVEHAAVVLLDGARRRALLLWVGPWEGWAIGSACRNVATHRPLTFALMANLLTAGQVTLEDVRIEAIRQRTYVAVITLRTSAGVQQVEARPSDAIALALHLDSPIYVAPEVLELAGFPIPPQTQPSGEGLDQIASAMAAKLRVPPGTPPVPREAEMHARQEVIRLVFGNTASTA